MATRINIDRPKIKRQYRVVDRAKQQELMDAWKTVALSNRVTRRALVETSIKFFAAYYLDVKLSRAQNRWAKKYIRAKKGLVLAPCGHGKTEFFSKILQLWIIVRNRNIRILAVSKSDGLAVKNLKSIRLELESNKKLIEDFGRFYSPDATWTDHQLYVIRNKNLKDPTLEAVGLNGAITGGRFDIIVLDDVIDALNVRSEEMREKTKDYIDGTLITRLEPWGVVWAIGTRKHYDDYYAHILKNKTWTCTREGAIVREPDDYEIVESDSPVELTDPDGEKREIYAYVKFNSDDHGETLWPEKWPMEHLLLLRYSIGSVVFEREYQNNISADDVALVKLPWLQACRDETLSYTIGEFSESMREKYEAVFQGTDPSLIDDKKAAEKKDSDYTVILTAGMRKEDKILELIGFFEYRGMSPAQAENAIENEYLRFGPNLHFLEANSFGTIYAHNLINERGLRITKHFTEGTRKNDLYRGVPALSVLFENRQIRLPYMTAEDKKKTDRIIKMIHGIGMEKHDDIPMALWIMECGVQRWRRGAIRMRRFTERVKKPKRL